jgi:hypothetical protein
MTCTRCTDDPCTCARAITAKREWLIQHCATPGCEVAIRVLLGQQDEIPICKWCLAGTAYYATTRQKHLEDHHAQS